MCVYFNNCPLPPPLPFIKWNLTDWLTFILWLQKSANLYTPFCSPRKEGRKKLEFRGGLASGTRLSAFCLKRRKKTEKEKPQHFSFSRCSIYWIIFFSFYFLKNFLVLFKEKKWKKKVYSLLFFFVLHVRACKIIIAKTWIFNTKKIQYTFFFLFGYIFCCCYFFVGGKHQSSFKNEEDVTHNNGSLKKKLNESDARIYLIKSRQLSSALPGNGFHNRWDTLAVLFLSWVLRGCRERQV